ncbi:MAG: 16S rRNA (cytosine(967)-C(5))-methyltransferase RsmB [Pseudomonadota bacterium]|nr:16S rRNA (cytosine(967)-C(5))-methyltransferase RsmB [Pseudomonadota bacterium]
MPSAEVCAAAARAVDLVTQRGRSLSQAVIQPLAGLDPARHAEAREIIWGTIRWYHRYQPLIKELLLRPLAKKNRILESVLVCAFYQFEFLSAPDFAVTSGSVAACKQLNRPAHCALINALLREHLRRGAHQRLGTNYCSATPDWLLEEMRVSWPQAWQQIASASNDRPPLTLRVNRQRIARDDYIMQLCRQGISASISPLSPTALTLTQACSVDRIPGFTQGLVSVQDAAAQLAPWFIGQLSGLRVLDACAAPGGKACQLLEANPDIAELWALDLPARMPLIQENLDRLGLQAVVIGGDARHPDTWWDGQTFDAIMIDAPCSGTGIIRRQPDIRINRRPSDLRSSNALQGKLLTALWELLKPGGRLLYITCSVLMEENDAVVGAFLNRQADAHVITIEAAFGQATRFGWQLLPGEGGGDGFYFARLDCNPTS